MNEWMKKFGLPPYEYFGFKNIFSGSMEGFNYKLWPKEKLEAAVWYGPNCFEKSEAAAEEAFENSPEGLLQLSEWLEKEHQKYLSEQE